MDLASAHFPAWWLWASAAGATWLLARSIRTAPWRRLQDPAQFSIWLGLVVSLMLMWTLNAGVKVGLNLHLLGTALATLMFGPQLALLAIAAVLLGSAINGSIDWAALGLNLLLMGCVPLGLTEILRRLLERCLPANYFIYIFLLAFGGSGVGVLAVGLMATGVLAMAQAYPLPLLMEEYLPFFLLLAFSEAWLSGMVMTLLVIYRPGWVSSFDDQRYLTRK